MVADKAYRKQDGCTWLLKWIAMLWVELRRSRCDKVVPGPPGTRLFRAFRRYD